MFYLAIDQHSKQLNVDLRNEDGDPTLRRQVSTSWASVRALFEKLAKDTAPEGGFVAILEVCGFNDWLVKLLEDPAYGCREIVLVQPEKRGKRKTDRRDANQLGEIFWVNRERLLAGKRVQNVRRVVRPTDPRRDGLGCSCNMQKKAAGTPQQGPQATQQVTIRPRRTPIQTKPPGFTVNGTHKNPGRPLDKRGSFREGDPRPL